MGNRFPRIYLVYFFLFSSYFVPVLHTSDFPKTYMLLPALFSPVPDRIVFLTPTALFLDTYLRDIRAYHYCI